MKEILARTSKYVQGNQNLQSIDRDCNLKLMPVHSLCLKMSNSWRVTNIVPRNQSKIDRLAILKLNQKCRETQYQLFDLKITGYLSTIVTKWLFYS